MTSINVSSFDITRQHYEAQRNYNFFPSFLCRFLKPICPFLFSSPLPSLQVLLLLTGLLLMSTVLYQVASLSSETKFSGISLRSFWFGMIINQKKTLVTHHEMKFPRKVNNRTSHLESYPVFSLETVLVNIQMEETLNQTSQALNKMWAFLDRIVFLSGTKDSEARRVFYKSGI